jgi:Flp pilus assembly protein TadD
VNSSTRRQRAGLLIFIVALSARLVHLAQLRGTPFFSVLIGDARGYDEWARRLADGDWIGTEVFYQAPLYPYFMGAVYALVGPDMFALRVIQAVLGSLAAVALAYAGWRLFSLRVGIVAGLVLALYPTAIFFDGLIQKSSLDLFFTCAALALIGAIVGGQGSQLPRFPGSTVREFQGSKQRRLEAPPGPPASPAPWARSAPSVMWLLLGVTIAALSLTRENALLLAALLMVWAVVRGAFMPAAIFAAGLAVVFVPVVARNAAVGGGFYLTTSQFGSNFFIGNNALSDGTYMALRAGRGSPEFERQDAVDLAQQAAGRPLTPGDVSTYWFDRSLAFIRSEPGAWLKLMVRKSALLVNTSEMLDTESQESHAEHSTLLAVTSPIGRYGLLVPLALFGMFVAWPRRRELWILYAMLAAYAASVVVFFVMARYRHPLLPFLILFASVGLVDARRFVMTAPRSRAAAAIAVALVAAVVTNRRMLSDDLMRAISEHNLAAALQENGRLDEAIAHYQRALIIQRDYAPAFNNLGTALVAKGEMAAAVTAFRESLRLQPNSTQARELLAEAEYDLGSVLLERGALREAEAALRESVRLKPDDAEAHNNLGIALASMGRLPEAIEHWRRALQIRPGFVDAERNLAVATAQPAIPR